MKGVMHPHLRLSIPRVRWVGGARVQASLSTPIPWRKHGGAGEALQGNGPRR